MIEKQGRFCRHLSVNLSEQRRPRRCIAEKIANLTLPALMAEIAKCEVVCSNCHRIRSVTRIAEGANPAHDALRRYKRDQPVQEGWDF